MSRVRPAIRVLASLCAGLWSIALPSAAATIPDELAQWAPWVLKDDKLHQCPRLSHTASEQPEQRRCVWPDELTIEMTQQGARFAQRWTLYGESWIYLPGNNEHWPLQVTVNNAPATVLEHHGRPALFAAPGRYAIEGTLRWLQPPQYLPVAADSALIRLLVDGKQGPVNLDAEGRLWLRDRDTSDATAVQNDTLNIEVFRLLGDDIPLLLETELRLTVSGSPREIVVGQLLPEGAQPIDFMSPLPARIEPDGRLRIQARAGKWRLRLAARFTAAPNKFAMRQLDADWPTQEIWSFRANPALRGVQVEGVAAVDPSQLDLPEEYRNLPTYLLGPDDTLTLQEQYRGDATPAANRLSLQRTLWLDFSGEGATARDLISGTLTHNWRLRARPELALGRIVSGGEPQVVTRLPGEQNAGIELRQAQVNVEAISRIEPAAALSASGWQQDFEGVGVELRLPPGWHLWHAAGPDRVQSSWLSSWDLWDLFICLLVVSALARLLGWQWGLLGVAVLALTYHESHSPLWSWAVVIGVLPLIRVLPDGRTRQWALWFGYASLAVLVLIILAFAVQQMRQGLYPQLEQQRAINTAPYSYARPAVQAQAPEALEERTLATLDSVEVRKGAAEKPRRERYRPTDNVQTGPGEPTWQWRQIHLDWSGPVSADEPLRLYLSPPWLTRLLKFIQLALSGLLLFGLARAVLEAARSGARDSVAKNTGRAGITMRAYLLPALLALTLGGYTPVTDATSFPPKTLLDELRAELTRAPTCAPQCASIQAVHLQLDDNRLLLRVRANAGASVALPLPGDKSWQPQTLLVDGQPAPLARDGDRLWVALDAGSHDLVLSGNVTGEQITLPFALTAHNVSVVAPDWRVEGLVNGAVPGRSLQLHKRERKQAAETLAPNPIAPFARVEREFIFDLDWQVLTTVTRVAPGTGPLNLRIGLLPGESVVSSGLTVENREVLVALDGRQTGFQWRSMLPITEQLTLTAANNPAWVEQWRVNSSPRWHIVSEGLPPVKAADPSQAALPTWRPWPGEGLTLSAIKPEPIAGPTTTVEGAALDYRPGARSAALQVSLAIRSSLGGDYAVSLPLSGKLQRLTIDGDEQTRGMDDNTVTIPLRPGLQTVDIQWALDVGVTTTTVTPALILATPANNIDVKMELPHSRWPLFISGPDIGPAMLYWGVLAVIIAVAVALGISTRRMGLSIPVKTWQWLLLTIGMSTVNMVGSIPVVLWFFAMEARRRRSAGVVNLVQIGLIALSIVALLSLFSTIPQSLLSAPDMQITGNGSSNYLYQWYQDRSANTLPQGQVLSVPLWAYRVTMLAWSLWLVFALLNWIKWGWQCLATGRLWENPPPRTKRSTADAAESLAERKP